MGHPHLAEKPVRPDIAGRRISPFGCTNDQRRAVADGRA